MNKVQKREGFTIIEVVLVLAIAGLIFLIVFLAVPALQRSQRDTQRRNDASRFMAQMQNYTANNKGKVPSTAAELTTFISSYLDNGSGSPDNWKDPSSGSVYSVSFTTDVTASSTAGDAYYVTGKVCDGENIASGTSGARRAALRMKLEGAGFFCQNN